MFMIVKYIYILIMKPHLTIQSLSTPMLANEKNIDFDGELSVEANAI